MKINLDKGVIMQKINLYAGMTVLGMAFVPQNVNAQCVSPVQDCYSLGYTQTSCPNGKGVKCPFGSGWYCGGTAAQDCIKLGYDKDCSGTGENGVGETCNGKYKSCSCDAIYQYSCSGTGYAGGSGTACGGKYTSCTCANGYEWKDGSCQMKVLNGAVGNLYYCNDTVVAVKVSEMSFYVALRDVGKMGWYEARDSSTSYSFCGNIKGTFPSREQLITIYNYKSSLNNMFLTNGGTELINDLYWSSTTIENGVFYFVSMNNGEAGSVWADAFMANVRPVLVP